ncbi:hypothetical protein PoB_000053000 [Plakobranchus ocellatus]|uniref:Uncharacterized protein n=1 Tax=Plakobranchus ocellatus TaxID=259542 RepID=A0AAV3XT89_9GAST|nr:hypothetical protein PoB_000053000 [Plakobranchus ocellatus]
MKLGVTFTLFVVFIVMVNIMPANSFGIYGNKAAGIKAGVSETSEEYMVKLAGNTLEQGDEPSDAKLRLSEPIAEFPF